MLFICTLNLDVLQINLLFKINENKYELKLMRKVLVKINDGKYIKIL